MSSDPFIVGLFAGAAVGMITMGFLAVVAYWQGHDDALREPKRKRMAR